MLKLVSDVVTYLNENPEIDEDLFMSEYEGKLSKAVYDLQEERRKKYVPTHSEILITDKDRITDVLNNANKYFKDDDDDGIEYSTPDLDTQTIYNIIARELEYSSRLVCKKGAVFLKSKKKNITVSPYGYDLMSNICYSVANHYRNDDYLDSKSMCLDDCYRALIQDALHLPEIKKGFGPGWEWKAYESESESDSDDPIETI